MAHLDHILWKLTSSTAYRPRLLLVVATLASQPDKQMGLVKYASDFLDQDEVKR